MEIATNLEKYIDMMLKKTDTLTTNINNDINIKNKIENDINTLNHNLAKIKKQIHKNKETKKELESIITETKVGYDSIMNTTNTLLEIVTKQHLPKFNIDLITNKKNINESENETSNKSENETSNKSENETSNKSENDQSIEKNINKTTDNKNELIDYKEIKKEVDNVFNNNENDNNDNDDNGDNTYSVPQLKKLFNI